MDSKKGCLFHENDTYSKFLNYLKDDKQFINHLNKY